MKTSVERLPSKNLEAYKLVLDETHKYMSEDELRRLRDQIDAVLPKPFDPTA